MIMALADRWGKRIEEIMEYSVSELTMWIAYLNHLKTLEGGS